MKTLSISFDGIKSINKNFNLFNHLDIDYVLFRTPWLKKGPLI